MEAHGVSDRILVSASMVYFVVVVAANVVAANFQKDKGAISLSCFSKT
jgi:hypothetical protein